MDIVPLKSFFSYITRVSLLLSLSSDASTKNSACVASVSSRVRPESWDESKKRNDGGGGGE